MSLYPDYRYSKTGISGHAEILVNEICHNSYDYLRITIKNCCSFSNVAMSAEAPESQHNDGSSESVEDLTSEHQLPEPKMMDRYECDACGYIYEPARGDGNTIAIGTAFEDIDTSWRCPVCGATKRQFRNIGPTGNPSGFKENLGYGLGVNTLTPGQKNILIFGSLLLGFLFFMSLYGLK